MASDVSSLSAARNDEDFVEAAAALVARSSLVSLNLKAAAFDGLVDLVRGARRADWGFYLSSKQLPIEQTAFEFAFNAALNGGYFHTVGNEIRQWEVNGSGSLALTKWIEGLRQDGVVPGIDVGANEVDAAIAPRLEGLPHAATRIDVCRQFADGARREKLEDIVRSCIRADGSFAFDLNAADALAATYPAGLGDDPFRKKAVLTFLMLAGVLEVQGHQVEYRMPIPSDYQIPRILAWKGVIEVSDSLKAMLQSGTFLPVDGEAVTHMRAAAVVAARRLGEAAGKSDDVVDGALFTTFRKDEDFKANSLPPMRCDSLWF